MNNSLHQIVLSFVVLLLGILAQFIHGAEKSIKRGLLLFLIETIWLLSMCLLLDFRVMLVGAETEGECSPWKCSCGDVKMKPRLCECACFTVWRGGNHGLRSNRVCFALTCQLNRGSKWKICAHRRLRIAVGSISPLVCKDKSGKGGAERLGGWGMNNERCLHSAYSPRS